MARFSAAAEQPVQQLAESGASARPGLALQPAAQDAAVAAWAAAEVRLRVAERPGAAAGLRQEVRDEAAGQQPEVPGVPAELPSVALPSAAAWAFHRDPILPWPEP